MIVIYWDYIILSFSGYGLDIGNIVSKIYGSKIRYATSRRNVTYLETIVVSYFMDNMMIVKYKKHKNSDFIL